jgi:hypothetical protein
MIAFVYADVGDAKTFYKKVTNNKNGKGCEFFVFPSLSSFTLMFPSENKDGKEKETLKRWQD